MNWSIYLPSLAALLLFAIGGWFLSLILKKVSHVDSMWSLFFLLVALVSSYQIDSLSQRGWLVFFFVICWALRLCIYLTWRNWGHEDSRYETIRNNNQPHFWFKSIYIVFGLQAVLAWIISISIVAAMSMNGDLNLLDFIASALFLFGLSWQVVADWQLTKFKANPSNKGKVLDSGLWRYSRHPNYFGECCIWWAFYMMALAVGAWWAIVSPILMTLLLLKVSGVSLLEETIAERRPAYLDYIKRTNAFIPGVPKN